MPLLLILFYLSSVRAQTKAWKKMVERDVAAMRQRSNRTALKKVREKHRLCRLHFFVSC